MTLTIILREGEPGTPHHRMVSLTRDTRPGHVTADASSLGLEAGKAWEKHLNHQPVAATADLLNP